MEILINDCDARKKLEIFASSSGFYIAVNGSIEEGTKKLEDK